MSWTSPKPNRYPRRAKRQTLASLGQFLPPFAAGIALNENPNSGNRKPPTNVRKPNTDTSS
jgi:hypothetical protein